VLHKSGVPDPNKATDLEKLREKPYSKSLGNTASPTEKLKVFRLEAVRTGFKSMARAKLPDYYRRCRENFGTVFEDPKLLMWDQAVTRIGEK